MEAKDTVMGYESVEQMLHTRQPEWVDKGRNIAETQAEISFSAGLKQGIWLFAWWKDGVQYVGKSGKTLGEAYKELGLVSILAPY